MVIYRVVIWLVYVCVYLAPIVAASIWADAYKYWLFSGTLIALWVLWQSLRSRTQRLVACAISGITALGNVLLAVSLYVQKTGFNDRFFAHLDAGTFSVVWQVYTIEMLAAGVYCFASIFLPVVGGKDGVVGKLGRWSQMTVAAGGIIGGLAYAPVVSALQYIHEQVGKAERPETIVSTQKAEKATDRLLGGNLPNLILIMAESLEGSYADTGLVGEDLTPNLTRLEQSAVKFTGMVQIEAASWTFGGMVASQCALPLEGPKNWLSKKLMNVTSAADGALLPDAMCLGDLLKKLGYHTAFLNGVSLRFAGDGEFLAQHGFDERFGREEFEEELPPDYKIWGSWGLHDDALFEVALGRIEKWEAERKPYGLVLLTIDTHDPKGEETSPSCGPKPLVRPMHASVRCADRLIARFIETIRDRWPYTVVVLMSDHLAHPNLIFPEPARPGDGRRVRFAIWSESLASKTITRGGTHLEIAPTVLDAMGFAQYSRHHAGASLLRYESPWLSHPDPESLSFAITTSLSEICVKEGSRIIFDSDGPIVKIGTRTLRATSNGMSLDQGIFALVFGEDGCFSMIAHSQEDTILATKKSGHLVVGLSNDPEFNVRIGAPEKKLIYFSGSAEGAGLRFGLVEERTAIETPQWTK